MSQAGHSGCGPVVLRPLQEAGSGTRRRNQGNLWWATHERSSLYGVGWWSLWSGATVSLNQGRSLSSSTGVP